MPWAIRQMETFDSVLKGLLETWQAEEGLIVLTSDHGNMEDLSTRKHTAAKVPLIVFGNSNTRHDFTGITQLSEIAPAISKYLQL
jgi:bisphosphoglycerate-independent phosphoglycerate mutase (AlkP superfamily)